MILGRLIAEILIDGPVRAEMTSLVTSGPEIPHGLSFKYPDCTDHALVLDSKAHIR